ncbi:MAG: thiamine-phosphate kinase, partial [Pirellulales bacterium]|nr:thiamine-phosphate kinase [Pirellulales bacterium]
MEREFVDWLRTLTSSDDRLRLGIGDDAAVMRWRQDRDLVVTTDLLVDQVHFDLASGVEPQRVGRKALAVNLSDLAAMATQPVGAVVSLALPRSAGMNLAKGIYDGMLSLAREFDCPIVGGDTNVHSGPLVISVTAFGTPAGDHNGVWQRRGAKSGDRLLVTGSLGGSILGRHLDFQPRVEEAKKLHDRFDIHAAMDISDGLAIDLARLIAESDCGATLIAADIPVSEAAHSVAAKSGRTPLEHALSDGEDFELLLAVEPATANRIVSEQPFDVTV